MFNQPLRGGTFNKETIIPEDKIEGTEIKVNSQKQKVAELASSHYYLLLNYLKDEVSILFRDVNIVEKQARIFNNETQKYEFKGKEYFQDLSDKSWAKNKEDFKVNILKAIEGEIYPREYPTIAEKLNQYKIASENVDLLKPMFAYASVNGEISSDSDLEYTDVKVNKNINELLEYLPLQNKKVQVDEHLPLYGVYLFITRWRSFNKLSYNRILPTEDFDMLMREQRVFDANVDKAEKENLGKKNGAIKNGDKPEKVNEVVEEPYKFTLSSILLWSVSPFEDTSSEWLKLFDANHFTKAYADRTLFREIMNQND
jgi:hypothetical protein